MRRIGELLNVEIRQGTPLPIASKEDPRLLGVEQGEPCLWFIRKRLVCGYSHACRGEVARDIILPGNENANVLWSALARFLSKLRTSGAFLTQERLFAKIHADPPRRIKLYIYLLTSFSHPDFLGWFLHQAPEVIHKERRAPKATLKTSNSLAHTRVGGPMVNQVPEVKPNNCERLPTTKRELARSTPQLSRARRAQQSVVCTNAVQRAGAPPPRQSYGLNHGDYPMRSTGQRAIIYFFVRPGQGLCGGLLPHSSLEDFEIAIDEGASRARGWRIHWCARESLADLVS